MSEPRTGAAYIRVSTDDQTEYSPASQLAAIRRYAAQHNIDLPDRFVFSDEGASGRTVEKRPAFHRMIAAARTKPRPFDVILLWKYSRFARSREDSILYKTMLRRDLGIEVVSVSEPVGDDKISILLEALIEAMDEYYSVNLAEEVRRGMTQRAREGQPNTYAPFGYRMEDGGYLPDPQTAPAVRRIFAAFVGGDSPPDIARRLNESGVHTRFGGAMTARGVRYILRNPVYTGRLRWTESGHITVSGGVHPALVSDAVFNRAQQLLGDVAPHARRDGQPYLLHGLAVCSCCGGPLTRAAHGALQCAAYARGRCPESHFVRLDQLKHAVLARIRQDFPALALRLPPERRNTAPKAVFPILPAENEPQSPTIEEQNLLLRAVVREIVFDRAHDRFFIRYRL